MNGETPPKTGWLAYGRWPLAGILGLYLLLTIGYGLLNPLFEAPDEHWHYFTAQFIADNRALPTVTADYDEWLSQEAAQPPLYYLLGALMIAPIEASQGREAVWPNPFAVIGDASATTNANRFVHTPAEQWPWQDFALAAHMLRLFSTLLGLGTLLCIYSSGRLLWPGAPAIALLATALTAVLPQFTFLHSAITNDALIIFLASAALWQLMTLWQTPPEGASAGRLVALGVTIGLAILSKNAGLLLLVYAGGVLSLRHLKNKTPRLQSFIFSLILVLIPALLVGGWLWWRNWQLYGDPLATEPFIRIAGGDRGYTLWQVLAESDGLWKSFFAVFGWFNLRPPDWVYWVWNGIVAAALAGLVWRLVGPEDQRLKIKWRLDRESLIFNLQQGWFTAVLLALWFLAVYAGLVTFMMQTEAAQGRLLLPAILPLALGVAYGLSRWRWPGVWVLALLLALATSVYSLLFVITPAYALPQTLTAVPPTATRLDADLGDGLQLVAAQIETNTAVPDQPVWFTLYWRATAPLAEAPEFVVEILGRDEERVGNLHSYHGRGLYPANLWPQNTIIADRFAVQLAETAVAPVFAPVFVGLAQADQRVRIGAVEIEPETWPLADAPPLAQLGDGILLTQAQFNPTSAKPGDVVTVNVQWQVIGPPLTDLTTLVHLGEAGQPPLATGDNQPLAGQYPTRLWSAGEVITDQYTLTIPARLANGRYPLWLGMYGANLVRLPLFAGEERQANDVYWIGEIEVRN
jgi:hypothetical protein